MAYVDYVGRHAQYNYIKLKRFCTGGSDTQEAHAYVDCTCARVVIQVFLNDKGNDIL